jgi:hypothetical protein
MHQCILLVSLLDWLSLRDNSNARKMCYLVFDILIVYLQSQSFDDTYCSYLNLYTDCIYQPTVCAGTDTITCRTEISIQKN